jgi:DNA topoisomerase-1
MEEKLDQVEDDKVDWRGMLKDFYQPFKETLKKAEENMNKIVILSDQHCPMCDQLMAIRSSRYGQFLGCVNYPECPGKIPLTRDGKPVPEDRPSEELCKKCESPMLIRYGKYGDYLACSLKNDPECKEQRAILKTIGVICPRGECGGQIVEKKSKRGKIFWGCSNWNLNECSSAYWYPPIVSGGPNGSNKCPNCGKMLIYKVLKKGDQVACSSKECDFAQPITGEEVRA